MTTSAACVFANNKLKLSSCDSAGAARIVSKTVSVARLSVHTLCSAARTSCISERESTCQCAPHHAARVRPWGGLVLRVRPRHVPRQGTPAAFTSTPRHVPYYL